MTSSLGNANFSSSSRRQRRNLSVTDEEYVRIPKEKIEELIKRIEKMETFCEFMLKILKGPKE